MPFAPSQSNPDTRILIDLDLDSGTVYFSDRKVVLDDGTAYFDGTVLETSPLELGVGPLLQPKIISPDFRITLDNEDGSIDDLMDADEFGNRDITVKIGEGTDIADYQTNRFVGVVRFPGGVQRGPSRTVTIAVEDVRSKDSRKLPINTFLSSTYPNLDTTIEGLVIPYVIGDWRTTAGGGEVVKCYQTDSSVGTGGEFTIADNALAEVEDVYLNGTSTTYSNVSLDNATFQLDVAFDPALDTVTANVRGATDDNTSTGNFIETLPDVLKWILKIKLGKSDSDLDLTAFTDWADELSASTHKVRRVLNLRQDSDTIIASILVEGFADLSIQDGKYTPVYRHVTAPTTVPTLFEHDIVNKANGAKDFDVAKDLEGVYANVILCRYRYDPINERFLKPYEPANSAEITRAKSRVERPLSLVWLYTDAGAQDRADRELFSFSSEVDYCFARFGTAGMTLFPTEQMRLVYPDYRDDAIGTPFQIRNNKITWNDQQAYATIWNLLNLAAGSWTDSSAPTWPLSNVTQKETHGFWCDASSYGDPSQDATSLDKYKWS